jgi:hypothetical protein
MQKILLIFSLLFSTHALSFDGSKAGFMLNLGAGYSFVDMSDSGADISKKTGSLGTGIDIGWGINERWAILAVQKAVFYDFSNEDLVHAVSGIGAMFSFEHLYISGSIGVGSTGKEYSLDLIEGSFGEAFTLGVGMNLISHLGLELYTTYSKADSKTSGDFTLPREHVTFNLAVVALLF